MPQVTIKIGQSDTEQHFYTLSNEKIKYLLKFVGSITDETEEEADLLNEIETGLKQVKKIRNGELPRKTLTQMLNGM
jgi:hypothetical protein